MLRCGKGFECCPLCFSIICKHLAALKIPARAGFGNVAG
jgi:hypothetical protein